MDTNLFIREVGHAKFYSILKQAAEKEIGVSFQYEFETSMNLKPRVKTLPGTRYGKPNLFHVRL